MSPDNIKYLEDNKHFHTQLEKDSTVRNISHSEKEGFLNVIRLEFSPSYMVNLFCSSCIADMIKFVYTQYAKVLRGEKIT